ncbi:hypothetical protein [Microbacterium sp. ZXX196]|uniref:hypothetical protein n=1 Tax=Microbacterium sp. ZXX196 TaxID=2609291 RepID=UPI0012B7F38A|nr:hypothetical protein [Microbacterium sp. ZXX196]MTE24849.1 hypothetical protein [Microbacterium sp. ZXX196]
MSIETDARQEAERRWPSNHLVDDPFGETGEAWSDPYGYDEEAQRAFIAGAVWASEQDTRETSDAEVLAALNARELSVRERNGSARHFSPAPDLTYYSDGNIADARAALLAAREVRR